MKSQLSQVGDIQYLRFQCAGCGSQHMLPIARPRGDSRVVWQFTGTEDRPSLTPSVRTTWGSNPKLCHFILTSGVQAFCGDDTQVPNQHLELPELED